MASCAMFVFVFSAIINHRSTGCLMGNFFFVFEVDSAFLLYAERTTIQYMDLVNQSRSAVVEGLRGAVAVAYDMKEDYIYWADMRDHKIFRRKFDGDAGEIF